MTTKEAGVHSWSLVAGTGVRESLSRPAMLAAEEVGAALARADLGLVTGGWPGVDEVVARAFGEGLRARGLRADQRLVQVIREGDPVQIDIGRIVRTRVGPSEWADPQSYADSLIVIGGLGGAYGSFLGALHKGLPRFPLAATGGDAADVYRQMIDLWDAIPNPRMTKADFQALSGAIESREDARRLAEGLVALLRASVTPPAATAASQPRQIFLSYSQEDLLWLNRLRTVLRPLERLGHLRTWAELDIEAGKEREAELSRKIQDSDAAVLLVSAHFLDSDYVIEHQLPQLLARAREGKLQLSWVLVSPCVWDVTELSSLQPAADPRRSLSEMADAEAQVSLVEIARSLR